MSGHRQGKFALPAAVEFALRQKNLVRGTLRKIARRADLRVTARAIKTRRCIYEKRPAQYETARGYIEFAKANIGQTREGGVCFVRQGENARKRYVNR